MLVACSKQGCNDKRATNYDPEVKKNNGTCVYIPGLKMLGETPIQVNVGSVYVDKGAVALNKDGTEVFVQTDNQVNTATKGIYQVHYSAALKTGTESLTRTVNVVIDRTNWKGTWKTNSECNLFFPDSLVTFVLGEQSNRIETTDMFDIYSPPTYIYAVINEQQISIPDQYFHQNMWPCSFIGEGEMNDAGNAFKLKVTYENHTTSAFGGVRTCILKYTKIE
jgi:hypothetical protein